MNQYKYAGDLVPKETVFGVENLPVGYFHTGSQGSQGARERRRERRSGQHSADVLLSEMQPMMMGQLGQPMMQPLQPMMGLGQQGMQPMMMGMPMMMGQPILPSPAPPETWKKRPWQEGEQSKEDWKSKKSNWQPAQWRPEKKKPWQADEWPAAKTEEEEPQAAKAWWERSGTHEVQQAGGKGQAKAQLTLEDSFEKTTRLLYCVQELKVLHKSPKEVKMHWCPQCRQKTYLGNQICITPSCTLPPTLQQRMREA